MNRSGRWFGPFVRFMLANGLVTVLTTLAILAAVLWTLDVDRLTLREAVPSFLLVLGVTSVFFFIIYKQGRRLRSEQEQRLAVFEHITDGVLILDGDLNILESNPAARRLMGRQAESGRFHFCSACTDDSGLGKRCDYDACFLPTGDGAPHEVSIRTVEGRMRHVTLAVSGFQTPDGERRYIFRLGEPDRERREERERITKMMTHSILQAQEKERKRLSRELHDGIGQSIYSALIQLDVAASALDDEDHPAQERLAKLGDSLRQTIEDLRHLSAELRPSVLDDMGLLAALRHHIQSFGRKFGIQVNFTYEGDKTRLPAAHETALYRIAQEALTNAAKYAQTDRIDVILKQGEREAELTVRDYGAGFDVGVEKREKGVGLYSMEERAEALNGAFRLESRIGSGTAATVTLPVPERGEDNEHPGSLGG